MVIIMMEPTTTLAPMTTMTDAISDTWRAIRRNHPDVAQAAVSVVPGRGSACGSVVWDADTPVLLVGIRTVTAGPEAILGYLLHQAAHGLVAKAGGHVAGNEGRYHSNDYRDAARSLGLEVEYASTGTGWSRTRLSDDLGGLYQAQLKQLDAADWKQPARSERIKIMVHCQCDPPRRLAVSPSVLDRGPIRCDVCGQPFAP